MMNKKYILMGLAVWAFVSCSHDEIKDVYRENTIDFRVAIDTRAEETTNENIESFSVTALDEDGKSYFSNIEFSDDAETVERIFTSEESYYWPISGNLYFYAYSPSDLSGSLVIDGTAKTLTGFTPSAAIGDQVDFITAKAVGNKAQNAEGVALEFNHQLSQIAIVAKNGNQGYVYNVKGVRIGQVASSGTFDFDGESWSDLGAKTDYETTYDTPILLDSDAEDIMGPEGNAMLIPHEFTGWDVENDKPNTGAGTYIAVYVNIETSQGVPVFPDTDGEYAWVAVSIENTWDPGYKYTYILDFTTGAGFIDPEDPDNPGEIVLGEPIKFSMESYVISWSNSGGFIDLPM